MIIFSDAQDNILKVHFQEQVKLITIIKKKKKGVVLTRDQSRSLGSWPKVVAPRSKQLLKKNCPNYNLDIK